MTIRPFETLERLRHRIAEAVVAQSGLRVPVLANELRRVLASSSLDGRLIPPPVFEGAFPFVPADRDLGELSGSVLSSKTVDALAGDNSGFGYSFPKDRHPYLHQLKTWEILGSNDPKSVVVSAGTGSGKTECFLVPLLDSLYRRNEKIEGVEAIMLYPLNALIASQQERLDAWTKPAKGLIRYCLYNGNLPEKLASNELRAQLSSRPQLVPDRETLRSAPPPLLVTNLTMLEYMLVRPQDKPIIDASRGKLKWIILDEAHTLVGSAAAEVALLLRRVMDAFGANPESIRFVATSATIGEGPQIGDQLRKFLADMGGVDVSQVSLITGDRLLPSRPNKASRIPKPEDLTDLPPVELYERLATYDPIWDLVTSLHRQSIPAQTFETVGSAIGVSGELVATALTRARSGNGETLAPLRVHSFHRSLPGIWCCTNPNCPETPGEGWKGGKVLFECKEVCPSCSMPTAELYTCNECGEAFMMAEETGDRLRPPRNLPPTDEFQFDAERDSHDTDDDEDEQTITETAATIRHCLSLNDRGLMPLFIDIKTGNTSDGGSAGKYRITSHVGNGKGPCPECGAANKSGDKLYPLRFGAPFILGNAAPILLSAMPPAEGTFIPELPQSAPDLPVSGRQLISFTDSRQGTARMAAKLQVDSERAFIRSFIYQTVQHRALGQSNIEEVDNIRKQINFLKNVPGWENHVVAITINDLEIKLKESLEGGNISWKEICTSLADRIEVKEWLPEVWGERADLFKRATTSASHQLAQALLLRELMRRPKLANSPETLGLAKLVYPVIEKITEAPSSFIQRGATLIDWKNWLICLVTFSIRSSLSIAISRELLQWIMRKGYPKSLVGPGIEPGKRQQRWPRISNAGNPPIVVELLRLGLGVNIASHGDRVEVNDWLGKAWNQLLPMLTVNENGERALDFDKLEVGAMKEAFHCPVTRRIVDVAPFGLSPYARTKIDRAEPVIFPACPANGDEAERRKFVETDETVSSLRERGLWTSIHDRTALFSPYARSAEHSAQLSPRRLRNYESEFKAGRINLLNCSTTMEMGVDIGSVNGVMMTNVPPSIANYKQRVGRAGRRGQPMSLAFTFAKDRPLDRETFRDPAAYLRRTIAAPRVALDSKPIVQRHVNAFLLSKFLSINSGNALKLRSGDFYGCPETPRSQRVPKVERPIVMFQEWLSKTTTITELQPALKKIVHCSVLADRTDLLEVCLTTLVEAEFAFVTEWKALQEQLPDATIIGATNSLEMHLKRLCREFLLSDLADRGFLPGHGFPNHVVSFELDRKDSPDENGDRPGQRHSGPKRPLDIAIRDYAPGSETVVDGQVYRVGGVTLNWQRPSSEEGVRDVQALRWSTKCSACGDNWTGVASWPDECRTCGSGSIKTEDYLKPAGFLRDRHAEVHAEVDRVDYIRPEAARVSVGTANWESLSQPNIGRFRVNRRGTVFYHTKGPNHEGYGLCLRCGRMEPMKAEEVTCEALIDHKPLRAKENFTQPCEGNNQTFALRSKLNLGHEIYTDVLEIQPAASAEVGAANAIAIAVREAIAQYLGIETDEMGFSIGPSRNAMLNATQSIYLFDRAAGGAGYVIRGADYIRGVMRAARKILDCPQNCSHACSSCVLVSDAPENESELDRHKAIAFMDKHFMLPDVISEADVFAQEADISDRPLAEIDEWLGNHGQSSLSIWARVQDIIDLEAWSATSMFKRWTDNKRNVTLILEPGTLSKLDASQILFLRDYSSRNGIDIAEGAPWRFENEATVFAYSFDGKSGHVWCCRDPNVLNVDLNWGSGHSLAISQAPFVLTPQIKRIDRKDLKPVAGAVVVPLGISFNGRIADFGAKLAKEIRDAAAQCGISQKDALKEVVYLDRYSRSPIVLKLLIDTVSKLAKDTISLNIETAADRAGGFSRNHIGSDIESDDDLWALAQAYGATQKLDCGLSVGQPPHKRTLQLEYKSGIQIAVDLDQGFGWLTYEGSDRSFNASELSGENANKLSKLMGKVSLRHGESQMVVWRIK